MKKTAKKKLQKKPDLVQVLGGRVVGEVVVLEERDKGSTPAPPDPLAPGHGPRHVVQPLRRCARRQYRGVHTRVVLRRCTVVCTPVCACASGTVYVRLRQYRAVSPGCGRASSTGSTSRSTGSTRSLYLDEPLEGEELVGGGPEQYPGSPWLSTAHLVADTTQAQQVYL
eukprot:326489-Rhodomonas_salina.1